MLEIDVEMIGVYSFPKGIKSILRFKKISILSEKEAKFIFYNNNDDYDWECYMKIGQENNNNLFLRVG